VFTSVNAVDITIGHFVGAKQASPLPHIAAVGPKTAEALRKHGLEPDFIPDEYIGEAIMSGLGDVNGKWILLPRAELASEELPKAISNAGGIAHEIVVYKTLPTAVNVDGLNALKNGVDVVTFTSASTVENFVAITRQHKLDPLHLPNNPLFACIGPVTEQAAKEAGFQNLVVAKEYTTDGLIHAITHLETL
jgi:uroporphyrinogen III methyltransferase/synthase